MKKIEENLCKGLFNPNMSIKFKIKSLCDYIYTFSFIVNRYL